MDFKLLLNSEILSSNAIVYQCTKQTAPKGAPSDAGWNRIPEPCPPSSSSSFLMMTPEVFPSLKTPRVYDSLWTKWSVSPSLAPISKDSVQWGKKDWSVRKL